MPRIHLEQPEFPKEPSRLQMACAKVVLSYEFIIPPMELDKERVHDFILRAEENSREALFHYLTGSGLPSSGVTKVSPLPGQIEIFKEEM